MDLHGRQIMRMNLPGDWTQSFQLSQNARKTWILSRNFAKQHFLRWKQRSGNFMWGVSLKNCQKIQMDFKWLLWIFFWAVWACGAVSVWRETRLWRPREPACLPLAVQKQTTTEQSKTILTKSIDRKRASLHSCSSWRFCCTVWHVSATPSTNNKIVFGTATVELDSISSTTILQCHIVEPQSDLGW